MSIVLQKTFGGRKTVELFDDDTVTVNGIVAPAAVVSTYNGEKRVSVNGDTILDINPYPVFERVKVTRQVGWQGNLGWRVELLDSVPEVSPGVNSLAVYSNPEADGYLFTTGAFILDAETGLWGAVCPAGHEPGQVDVNFSMLYASLPYSPFTLWAEYDFLEVEIGGDI